MWTSVGPQSLTQPTDWEPFQAKAAVPTEAPGLSVTGTQQTIRHILGSSLLRDAHSPEKTIINLKFKPWGKQDARGRGAWMAQLVKRLT